MNPKSAYFTCNQQLFELQSPKTRGNTIFRPMAQERAREEEIKEEEFQNHAFFLIQLGFY